jgi:hypothetical protein
VSITAADPVNKNLRQEERSKSNNVNKTILINNLNFEAILHYRLVFKNIEAYSFGSI